MYYYIHPATWIKTMKKLWSEQPRITFSVSFVCYWHSQKMWYIVLQTYLFFQLLSPIKQSLYPLIIMHIFSRILCVAEWTSCKDKH